MNPRRDMRNNRVALFDGIEEGGIRASSSYSHEIDEHDNERAVEGLQDRVNLLKRLSGDIHEEVESHNRMLDRMGNDMDASRGILSGTMDKFKMLSYLPDLGLRICVCVWCIDCFMYNNEFDLPQLMRLLHNLSSIPLPSCNSNGANGWLLNPARLIVVWWEEAGARRGYFVI
ncbi:hypothetical protein SCA6_014454 [Theobroma cacao]